MPVIVYRARGEFKGKSEKFRVHRPPAATGLAWRLFARCGAPLLNRRGDLPLQCGIAADD